MYLEFRQHELDNKMDRVFMPCVKYCVYVTVRVCICMHVCVHTGAQVCVSVCKCVRTGVRTCTYVCVCMYYCCSVACGTEAQEEKEGTAASVLWLTLNPRPTRYTCVHVAIDQLVKVLTD